MSPLIKSAKRSSTRTRIAVAGLFTVAVLLGLLSPLIASANHPEPRLPLTAEIVQALSACNGNAGTAIPTGTFGNATTPPDRNNTSSSNEYTTGSLADLMIHANAESDPKELTLDISGSHNVIDGLVNSRSHLKIGGSWNLLRHGTDYGQRSVSGKVAFDLTGSNNCFSPIPTQTYENEPASPAGFPLASSFDPDNDGNVLEHFAPGTPAALAAMGDSTPGPQYFVCGIPDPDGAGGTAAAVAPGCSGSGASALMDRNIQGQTLEKGLYFVTGRAKISASNTNATLTVVTGQQLNVNGSFQGQGVSVFRPYTDASGSLTGGLLFASQWDEAAPLSGPTFPDGSTANDSPNTDRAEDALKIEGSLSRFEGIIVATNGRTELAGEQNQFGCPVMGDRVRLNGSKLYFNPKGCVANPGLTISKTPDGEVTVNAGDDATFTITVKNNGSGPATNVDIDDVLPGSGWSVVSGAGCTISGGNSLHCDIASLAAGASFTVVVKRATTVGDCLNDTGQGIRLDNGSLTTTDTGDDARAAADNNPAVFDSGHLFVRCPDVSVQKTPDEPANDINAGENATFTITFTNNGPGTATGVGTKAPHDQLPPGLTWSESGDAGSDPDNKCSVTGNVLECAGITLAAGASYSVRVTAPTTAANCGKLDNSVTLTADGDRNSANDTDTASIDVLCPDLVVQKTPDGDVTVNAGADGTFTITLKNNGPGSATNVDIDDELPGSGWTLVSGPDGCAISGADDNKLHCDIASLAAGASVTVVVKRPTTAADCAGDTGTGIRLDNGSLTAGDASDDALADADNNPQVNDPGHLFVRCPDVSVAKGPDESNPAGDGNDIDAGANAVFTITFTNHGPGTATGVGTKGPVHDVLPAGLTWSESGGDPADKCSVAGNVLECSGITLAANATYSVSVSAPTAAADCGTLRNTVTLTADGDTNPANNTDDAAIDVLCPDLVVEKTPDGGALATINAGDDASFTITVTNNGDGPAKNVTINDVLPGSGWSFSGPAPAGCTISGDDDNILHCDLGTLASGASATVTVTRPTTAADCAGDDGSGTGIRLDNGSLTPDDPSDDALAKADQNPQVNDPGHLFVRCPDVSVQKTPDAFDNDLDAGSTATFTITFFNHGPGTATGVGTNPPAHDVLPGGLAWTESAGDPDGKCSVGAGVLECEGITLLPSTSYSVSVSAPTTEADCGTLRNTVTLTADGDTNPANNTDDAEIDVHCPVLSVEKTPDGATINAGDDAVFTINVGNSGAGLAKNVTIDDVLPGSGWSFSGPAPAGCTISGDDDNVLHCDVGDLATSAGFTVAVQRQTTAADCAGDDGSGAGVILDNGSLTAVESDDALADADNHGPENDPGHLFVRCPDVSVTKGPDESVPAGNGNDINAGAAAVFTITFTNHGPGTATGVGTQPPLHDALPGGLAWTESTDPGSDPEDKCSIAAGVLECNGITLAAGASYSVSVTAPTTAAACGTLVNTVTLVADGDTNPANNSDGAEIDVRCPELSVQKTPDGEVTVNAGDDATFTIVVTNNGAAPATNVTLDDVLPGSGWSFSGPAPEGCTIGGPGTNELHCDIGTLAAGASVTVVVTRPTTAADCAGDTGGGVRLDNGSLTEDKGDDALADADENPPVSDHGHLFVQCPNVSVQKTPDEPDNDVNAGNAATFTITFFNHGPGTATGVGTKPPHDTLPAGLTWTESSGDPEGKCSVDAGVLRCEGITLAAGTSYAVSVSAPTTAADCGTLDNTVTLTADGDTNAADDTDSGEIDVICPDVSVQKAPDEPDNDVNVGSNASFSITFTNHGPGTATGVGTKPPDHDVLPAGLTWSESGGDPENKCTVTGGVLECSGITLGPNATYTVSVSAPTSAANCGTLENTVTLVADGDTDATNNTDTAEIDVICGALQITKTAKHVGAGGPDLVATFTVVDSLGVSRELTTDAAGVGCIDGLGLGDTQSIAETTVPAGYLAPSIANVTVLEGTCADGRLASGGVDVPVENKPLTNVKIVIDSQVPGATSTTVICDDAATANPFDFTFTTDATGDGTLEMNNLPVPPDVVLNCRIVVDP